MAKISHRNIRLGIIISLLSLLVSILLLEAFLRVVDPTGAYVSGHDSAVLRQNAAPHPTRGYVLKPGTYEFRHWTLTINAEGQRVVPHTNPNASCTIAVLGDSSTFGIGVNDDETWPDLIAAELDVQIINTALSGYNSANIRAVAEETPADGYIYRLNSNDAQPPEVWHADWPTRPLPSGIGTYVVHGFVKPHLVYPRWPGFEEDFAAIVQNRAIFVFAHEHNELAMEVRSFYPDLVTLPSIGESQHLSAADRHPDPEGYRTIARSVLPYVREWLVEVCPEAEFADERDT